MERYWGMRYLALLPKAGLWYRYFELESRAARSAEHHRKYGLIAGYHIVPTNLTYIQCSKVVVGVWPLGSGYHPTNWCSATTQRTDCFPDFFLMTV